MTSFLTKWHHEVVAYWTWSSHFWTLGILLPLLISSFFISVSLCTYIWLFIKFSTISQCLRITSHLYISYVPNLHISTPNKINSQNLSFCIRKGSVGPNFMPPGFKPRPLQEPIFICIKSLSLSLLSISFYLVLCTILPQILNLKIIPSLIFVNVLIHHCMNFHSLNFFFLCFLNFLEQEDIFVSMHKHNLSNYVEAARFLSASQVQSYHIQIHFYKYLIWITLSSIEFLASNFKQHSN